MFFFFLDIPSWTLYINYKFCIYFFLHGRCMSFVNTFCKSYFMFTLLMSFSSYEYLIFPIFFNVLFHLTLPSSTYIIWNLKDFLKYFILCASNINVTILGLRNYTVFIESDKIVRLFLFYFFFCAYPGCNLFLKMIITFQSLCIPYKCENPLLSFNSTLCSIIVKFFKYVCKTGYWVVVL